MGTHVAPESSALTFVHKVHNATNINSAIEYCVQVGPESDPSSRVLLALLCQIANEPVFDQLRTKEQLGYMVFSGMRKQQMMGFRIIIQSEKSPTHLESRVGKLI